MHRTAVMLPNDLKIKAENLARTQGLSLGAFIRKAMNELLKQYERNQNTQDPLFADKHFYTGASPKDLAAHHDDYLYE